MKEELILKGYEYAKAQYAAQGVDVDAAIAKADAIPVSMHCWQGDDVIGFDGSDSLSGGIQTTGNYPGRARTADELRADIAFVRTMIPGATKLNLHASYAEKNGKQVDRDAYTIDLFQNWVDFAKEQKIGLDFNPTYFAHPKMDGDFSLSSTNPAIRKFWIEHGKRCREIGNEFYKQLGQPCAINFWMPDGYKDVCADTKLHRDLMIDSLDQIFAEDIDRKLVPCGLESKLFGVGVESYTVASHEFSYGYAVKNGLLYTLDAGHFHPTEVISAKLTACLPFLEGIILHVSRPVRWDSDHVILLDDEIQRIMDEVILNNYQDRTFIALDYFDASINRISAWVTGLHSVQKALLYALLEPKTLKALQDTNNFTELMVRQEELKTMPFGAVWEEYLRRESIPQDYFAEIKRYEADVLSKR